jgi:hypothetical protein
MIQITVRIVLHPMADEMWRIALSTVHFHTSQAEDPVNTFGSGEEFPDFWSGSR